MAEFEKKCALGACRSRHHAAIGDTWQHRGFRVVILTDDGFTVPQDSCNG
jgi:hypothetical protein